MQFLSPETGKSRHASLRFKHGDLENFDSFNYAPGTPSSVNFCSGRIYLGRSNILVSIMKNKLKIISKFDHIKVWPNFP